MEGRMLLPLSVDRLRIHAPCGNAAHCVIRLVSIDALKVEADIDVLDANGLLLVSVRGLVMGSSAVGQSADAAALNARLLDVTWAPWDIPGAKNSRRNCRGRVSGPASSAALISMRRGVSGWQAFFAKTGPAPWSCFCRSAPSQRVAMWLAPM
jgi:hypothetical protein